MARGRGSSTEKQKVKPAAATPKERFELLLENIEQQNRATMEAVSAMGNQLRQEMREGFARLEARADVHEAILRQHSTDIQELKTDVQRLKTDVQELKTDVQRLKTDVQELKTDVQELKTDVQGLKEAVRRIEVKLDGKADVSQVRALEARVTALEGR
jgi:outer membrane murein-binding lipoprotein Lpp